MLAQLVNAHEAGIEAADVHGQHRRDARSSKCADKLSCKGSGWRAAERHCVRAAFQYPNYVPPLYQPIPLKVVHPSVYATPPAVPAGVAERSAARHRRRAARG